MPVCPLAAFASWSVRRWLVAALTAAVTFLALGLTTSVLPNPVFGRSVPPTDWAMEVLLATAVLTGLIAATYVSAERGEALNRRWTAGALLSYFAIGCPVCNKLALLALGTSGALRFFAPVQPYLAVAGLGLLGWALMVRLRGEATCAFTPASVLGDRQQDPDPGRPAGGQRRSEHPQQHRDDQDDDDGRDRDHQDLDPVTGQ